MNINNCKKFITPIYILLICFAVFAFLYYKNLNNKTINYNQVINSKTNSSETSSFYKSAYYGRTIEWQGKISNFYSQITGIKFCIIDKEHQNTDISKSCDWFWAMSDEVKNADDYLVNPDWDGKWVNYILKHYGVSFDENKIFYNDIYKIKGKINGVDCGVTDKCIPDIEIISITK